MDNLTQRTGIDMEAWKDVVGYEGWYQVSNLGRVKRVKEGSSNTWIGKILRPAIETAGYTHVNFSQNGILKLQLIHRLVAQAFIPNPENKPQVNHKNGIRADNRVENLEWVTASENNFHASKVLGVWAGEKNGMAKLTKEAVFSIRRLLVQTNFSQKQIAKKFRVSQSLISRINIRKNWNHI